MSSWKQPTPTDINDNPNLTFLDRAIFREILSLCQNDKYLAQFIHADRHYKVTLKRGQCILKISQIAKDLDIDWKRIRRSVETISKWYSKMESKGMPFGLIITVKNYDNVVNMENRMENRRRIEGEWKENRRRANKSNKNYKSDKSDKNIDTKVSCGVKNSTIQDVFNFYIEKTRSREKLSPQRRQKIKSRIKDFGVNGCKQAINGVFTDPFLMGENDRGWKANIDYIFRSFENTEKLIIKAEKYGKKPNQPTDPLAKLSEQFANES